MSNRQVVREILDDIDEVKLSVMKALNDDNKAKAEELMGNVFALEACLVVEAKKLIAELEEKKTA